MEQPEQTSKGWNNNLCHSRHHWISLVLISDSLTGENTTRPSGMKVRILRRELGRGTFYWKSLVHTPNWRTSPL